MRQNYSPDGAMAAAFFVGVITIVINVILFSMKLTK